jgi:hypothetical protein
MLLPKATCKAGRSVHGFYVQVDGYPTCLGSGFKRHQDVWFTLSDGVAKLLRKGPAYGRCWEPFGGQLIWTASERWF